MRYFIRSFALFLFGSTLSATTYVPEVIEARLKEAVVVADVTTYEKRYENHPTLFAVSQVRARIDKIWELNPDGGTLPGEGDFIEIESAGGEREERGVLFAGLPRPSANSRYRVYLKRSNFSQGHSRFEITGLEAGLVPLNPTRAFSRNRTDGSNGEGTGAFLFWDSIYFPVPYFISAPSFQNHAEWLSAIDASFKTWRDPEDVKVEFLALGCSNAVRNENDGLNNIILVTQNWNFDTAAIAITRNFYVAGTNEKAGLILDTDILLNNVNHQFTVTGETGKHDIQNILTHEVGHFIGLGHEVGTNADTDATMYASATTGETKKRALHLSDLNGVRSAYTGVGKKLSAPVSACNLNTSKAGCAAAHSHTTHPQGLLEFLVFLLSTLGIGRFLVAKRTISTDASRS